MIKSIPEIFGSMVFNDDVMRQRLSKDVYDSLSRTIEDGADLDINLANDVAEAMKDWAIENGATHYTHWFQPMTGITAEKHDSFISPQKDGTVIMEFSGKELIKGEPDASSFPNGGLRATFEARGYTSWDPTSYAFVKDHSLYIPTAFYSFSGQVLDKKTPLLRSIEVIKKETERFIKLFGETDVTNINAMVGAEQEYFLIDKEMYKKRRDIVNCGRTLFGDRPAKGQEMEDHYFGVIKPRVKAYMEDLDNELWKLGIYSKTEHNEAAPAQHEMAPVYTTANIAADQNQLTMEIMKKVADRHGLYCLLHEKPFKGVNGSGKHNNWSVNGSNGFNLFKGGKKPWENKRFLLAICAVIRATDIHQDLLRISVSSSGNDHRLGGNEAPPAIVSMYLGDELCNILESVEKGVQYKPLNERDMDTGVHVLPHFRTDSTDRNRTSPFAFTINKFEFRMPGSSLSISDPNVVLNTIVGDSLEHFSDILEKAKAEGRFDEAVDELIRETMQKHKRIIFNGNNYSEEWIEEAKRRGLLNLKTAADAIPYFVSKKNIELFSKHKIFSPQEMESRCGIMLENYCKTLNIESLTMLKMAKKDILPAAQSYINFLLKSVSAKKEIGIFNKEDADYIMLNKMNEAINNFYNKLVKLQEVVDRAVGFKDIYEESAFFKYYVLNAMENLRDSADTLENLTARKFWPYPTYSDLIFSV